MALPQLTPSSALPRWRRLLPPARPAPSSGASQARRHRPAAGAQDAETDEILGKMKVSALLEALPKVGKVRRRRS